MLWLRMDERMTVHSIVTLNEIDVYISKKKHVMLYGAGRVSYSFLQYLILKALIDHVFCVVVSKMGNNPDSVLGVPVCCIDDVDLTEFDGVIVSSFEGNHGEILANLCKYGIQEVCVTTNILYARLRAQTYSMDADIFNNTQRMRGEVQKLRTELRDVKRSLNDAINSHNEIKRDLYRLTQCLKRGVSNYDELVTPAQYEKELARWYKGKMGYDLDIDNPRTFNEKIQWIKLHGVTPHMTLLADKYKVREWIAETIGEEYLIPLIGVYDRFEDIDFDTLPNQFVMKCNHGSGMNEVVTDKSSINEYWLGKRFARWLNINYAFVGGSYELQYKDITPRIIVEKYLTGKESGDLMDYKVHCFGGEPRFIQVIGNRDYHNHTGKQAVYDFNWKRQNWSFGNYPTYKSNIKAPKLLNECYQIAKKLCKGFAYVRVDLYLLDQIYFGELTFTPHSGGYRYNDNFTEEVDHMLGDMIVF